MGSNPISEVDMDNILALGWNALKIRLIGPYLYCSLHLGLMGLHF
jgi:hypothetical protein